MDTSFRWHDKSNGGFTLVELSIVLLVIGLLVSGILVGQDMIRAAELRSVATQKDQIQTAVTLFKDKYSELPGDLSNATVFWGAMTGCHNSTSGTGTQTCNGDGNGKIEHYVPINTEFVLFWQHLANAGLIKGKYTGAWVSSFGGVIAEGQLGVSNVPSTWWNTGWYGNNVGVGDTQRFEGDYGNVFIFSSDDFKPFTPEESYGIDKKIDDGFPAKGAIRAPEARGRDCNTVDAGGTPLADTAAYNLLFKGKACDMLFVNMW